MLNRGGKGPPVSGRIRKPASGSKKPLHRENLRPLPDAFLSRKDSFLNKKNRLPE